MSSFTAPLHVIVANSGEVFKLAKSFEFYYDGPNGRETFVIPEGFVTDFASSPRILWSVFSPIGKQTKAALVHDFLYSYELVDRETADKIFYEGMIVLGVNKYIAKSAYYSVKWWGTDSYGTEEPEFK